MAQTLVPVRGLRTLTLLTLLAAATAQLTCDASWGCGDATLCACTLSDALFTGVCGSCIDGCQNGAETDVDCGGGSCAACAAGQACSSDSDCTGPCVDAVCATCGDGFMNGDETCVDGGGTCGLNLCSLGSGCDSDVVCVSGSCSDSLCRSCDDGIQNGDETCVDGGGTCGAACITGDECLTDADCMNDNCLADLGECSLCGLDSYELFGVCVDCPGGIDNLVLPLIYVAIAAGALFALVVMLVWRAHPKKEDFALGMDQAADFLIYAALMSQTLAQVGGASLSQNDLLQKVYRALTLSQFNFTGVAAPECVDFNPFLPEYAVFSVVLYLTLANWLMTWKRLRLRVDALRKGLSAKLRGVANTLLVVLHLHATNSALRLVDCVEVDGTERMATDMSVICYEGKHRLPAALAWLTLLLYVVGFPAVSFVYVWRRKDSLRTKDLSTVLSKFVRDEFRPRYFWFIHLNILMNTTLALAVLLLDGVWRFLVCEVALLAALGLLQWLSPYAADVAWKSPVKKASLALAVVVCVLNLTAFYEVEEERGEFATPNTALSWVVLSGMLLVLALLVRSFHRVVLHGDTAELMELSKAKADMRLSQRLERGSVPKAKQLAGVPWASSSSSSTPAPAPKVPKARSSKARKSLGLGLPWASSSSAPAPAPAPAPKVPNARSSKARKSQTPLGLGLSRKSRTPLSSADSVDAEFKQANPWAGVLRSSSQPPPVAPAAKGKKGKKGGFRFRQSAVEMQER